VGGLRAIADIIKSKPKDVSVVQLPRKEGLLDKVQELVPDADAFQKYVQDLANARRFAGTRASVLGNSQTAEKLLDAMDLAKNTGDVVGDVATGNKAGLVSRAFDAAKRLVGPGETTRAAIADRLLESDPVNIQKILDAVAKAQASQALAKKVSGIGTAGAAPLAGGLTGSRLRLK